MVGTLTVIGGEGERKGDEEREGAGEAETAAVDEGRAFDDDDDGVKEWVSKAGGADGAGLSEMVGVAVGGTVEEVRGSAANGEAANFVFFFFLPAVCHPSSSSSFSSSATSPLNTAGPITASCDRGCVELLALLTELAVAATDFAFFLRFFFSFKADDDVDDEAASSAAVAAAAVDGEEEEEEEGVDDVEEELADKEATTAEAVLVDDKENDSKASP